MVTSLHNAQQSYAAIILAAGYSSRMQGELKALLPLGIFPFIVRKLVESFHIAGIRDIHLVVGHEHERVAKAVNDLGVCIVYNSDFAKGMYSSVCAGVQSVMNNGMTQAACILPVDAALVKASTLHHLLSLWHEEANPMRILMPCFLKRCGHPPIIGHAHFAKILQYQAIQGGLRGYFASCCTPETQDVFLSGHAIGGVLPNTIRSDKVCLDVIRFIPLADEGIVSDIDTVADYAQAQDFLQITQNRRIPSLLEAWHLLQEANLPDRIIRHSCQIALGALRLGLALQRDEVNPLYHICGGLLHDIKRLEKDHALMGQEFLQKMDWKEIAYIVGAHTILPKIIHKAMHIDLQKGTTHKASLPSEDLIYNDTACLYASICVYLADKFYAGEYCVGIKTRFANVRKQFTNDPIALQAIREREAEVLAVNDWFYSMSGVDAYTCVQTSSGHELEKCLQALE